jgi:glyoxylase-like metal-dependent hydrolase (beta-lactamase superfamily II)
MASNYAIHALMVGMSESWRRSGIMPCVRSDVGRDDPVPYIIWCVQGDAGPIIVDTGYHPDYVTPEWAQGKNFIEPPALLSEIGIGVDDVRTVIVTHFHQDHFTGFDYFPRARFIIQREEYEFWTGPMMRHDYLNNLVRPKVRPALDRMILERRMQLVDGDAELHPGLEVLKAGGHTPGSQMVAVQTSDGKAVLCGDIAYTYRNLRERLPVGWYTHLADSVVALERALTTASRPELAFPNHDPAIMRGKRITRVV